MFSYISAIYWNNTTTIQLHCYWICMGLKRFQYSSSPKKITEFKFPPKLLGLSFFVDKISYSFVLDYRYHLVWFKDVQIIEVYVTKRGNLRISLKFGKKSSVMCWPSSDDRFFFCRVRIGLSVWRRIPY